MPISVASRWWVNKGLIASMEISKMNQKAAQNFFCITFSYRIIFPTAAAGTHRGEIHTYT